MFFSLSLFEYATKSLFSVPFSSTTAAFFRFKSCCLVSKETGLLFVWPIVVVVGVFLIHMILVIRSERRNIYLQLLAFL